MSNTDNNINAAPHRSHSYKSTNDKFVEPSISIPIGEVADVIAGGTPKASDPKNFATPKSGIAWLTPADLSGFKNKYIAHGARDLSESGYNSSSAKLLPAGTIVFSSRAPIGYLAIAQNAISTNQGFKNFVLPESINSTYAYYYLKSIRDVAESLGTGTTFKEISGSTAKTLPFLIFPLAEQKVIADKLDELLAQVDALKTRLDAIPAILKRFRQSSLAAAVSGKLTEEWRGENSYCLFGDFEIPTSWKQLEINDIADVKGGKRLPKGEELVSENTGFPYIRAGQLKNGTVISGSNNRTTQMYLTPNAQNQISRYTVRKGDAFLTIVGASIGDAGIIPESHDGANLTENAAKLTNYKTEIAEGYLSYWLRSEHLQHIIRLETKSAAQGKLALSRIKTLPFPSPCIAEQTEIVRRVEQLFTYTDQVEQQVKNAQARVNQLTQSILAKAFRGELTEQWRKDNPELVSGDNSAEALLERIKAERAAATPTKKTRAKKHHV